MSVRVCMCLLTQVKFVVAILFFIFLCKFLCEYYHAILLWIFDAKQKEIREAKDRQFDKVTSSYPQAHSSAAHPARRNNIQASQWRICRPHCVPQVPSSRCELLCEENQHEYCVKVIFPLAMSLQRSRSASVRRRNPVNSGIDSDTTLNTES